MPSLPHPVFAYAVGHVYGDRELAAGTEYEVLDEFTSSALAGASRPVPPNSLTIKTPDGLHWLIRKDELERPL